MVLPRLSRDLRSLLLILALALSLLVVVPRAAEAGVNGCPHYETYHIHGFTGHTYDFVTHKNIRVEGIGWVHSHTYLDLTQTSDTVIRKLC